MLTRFNAASRCRGVFVQRIFSGGFSVLLGILTAGLAGCAHTPAASRAGDVRSLQTALTALAPTVRADEAGKMAGTAYDYSEVLATRYQVVWPPLLHNYLVNSGYKERGLCYEWAEDLLAQLEALQLKSLELHWGLARYGTAREHNSLVVTARGQPFEQGIVLDPWRRSGRLVWVPVAADRYPWVEGELTPPPATVTP